MTFDYNRERLRKEKDRCDTVYQCNVKYQNESRSTKRYTIPKYLIEEYINCSDKDYFLKKYNICEVV